MKVRLDRLLVERGFFESGEKARRAVMAGTVTVDGRRADKAGKAVDAGCALAVAAPAPFVGRGGEKLDAALKTFRVPVSGRHCLDLGASTGGFTDCLLKAGATSVIAVDVGRGQLDRRLREDPRVVVRERTNARYLSREDLPRDAELVTVDLSFISLDKVLPAISRLIVGGEIWSPWSSRSSRRGGARCSAAASSETGGCTRASSGTPAWRQSGAGSRSWGSPNPR